MAFNIPRLRRWFAVSAVAAATVVAGAYFYARHRVENALKEVPQKIGVDIRQSAQGFTYSQSDGKRTLFKIQASKAVQFKQGEIAELHDVAITLYGRDSGRFDQIYGSNFEYDPRSGDVTAKGEVLIDLEANPAGITNPDQTQPKELKNPIHLRTSGLVFNQKTGNAYTNQEADFRTPQASGSCMGLKYTAKARTLILKSQVTLKIGGAIPTILTASGGVISKTPKQIALEQVHLQRGTRRATAEQATLLLGPDNTLERILANGNVQMESNGAQIQAARLELALADRQGALRTAVFAGDVRARTGGPSAMQASAEQAVLSFAAGNALSQLHAEGHVKLLQHQTPTKTSSSSQDLELTSAAVNFFLDASGHHLVRAETPSAAQIAVRPSDPAAGPTLITASRFTSQFDSKGKIRSVHGVGGTRIVSSNPGHPDRVSTADGLDAGFRPGQGIDFVTQQGNLVYNDGERTAWAERGRYTPSDQFLILTGSPRVVQGGMTTTARSMRLNRASGDAFAEGDVKTTYSDLKPQPDGALLSSSSPIHVTAHSMVVHRSSAIAIYNGKARLWQDANVVEAPTIEFNREHRSVLARAEPKEGQSVSTVFVQTDKKGKVTAVSVTSPQLSYSDAERKVHFSGGVSAKGADFTVTAKEMDIFLQARTKSANDLSAGSAGKIEQIVAEGQVSVTQATRRATGDRLVYTAAEDKFVMTGGPPSIFDAEHGKITGVSLTLFRGDDRVLVEGTVTSPSVTQIRVAR